LPEGLQVLEVEHVSQTLRAPEGQRVTYLVSDLIPWGIHSILQSWTKHLQEPLVKKTKRREITARLGDILLDVRPVSDTSLEIDLYEGKQLCFRPIMILERFLGESKECLSGCRICKIGLARFVELEENGNACRAHHQR
ncbi:MAG: hypothetical protein RBS57_18205, partial [Desulforhabdus sp.]|nr:hypothetical protein [Desulforhabdus sp.]